MAAKTKTRPPSPPKLSPIVETLPPAVIDDDSAWIGGKVNPQNSATSYYIELADNPAFTGSEQIPGSLNGNAGSGNEPVFANHHAEELEPSTTYYYRVVATSVVTVITTGKSESVQTRAQPFDESPGLPPKAAFSRRLAPPTRTAGR